MDRGLTEIMREKISLDITYLKERIYEVIQPLLAGVRRVALIDFPQNGNPGDSAIWLGQKALLHKLGIQCVYQCDWRTYDPVRLRAVTDLSIPILLSGGGNITDLWPTQDHRERLIRDFSDRKIIQLPQSIYFSSEKARKQAATVFNEHPDFTLLVRDEQSLEIAKEGLGVGAELCPDMACSLHPLGEHSPSGKKLWITREDPEKSASGTPEPGPDWEVRDWVLEKKRPAVVRINQFLSQQAKKRPGLRPLAAAAVSRLYDRVARIRVARAVRMLAGAETVVTERLHGHIFCLSLGIPHICVDNSYGKVRSFFDTWVGETSGVEFVDNCEDVLVEQ